MQKSLYTGKEGYLFKIHIDRPVIFVRFDIRITATDKGNGRRHVPQIGIKQDRNMIFGQNICHGMDVIEAT